MNLFLNSTYPISIRARLPSVSPGHLAWSRGLSTSQSAHHFMYINLRHRPLGIKTEHTYNYTEQYTLQYISSVFLPTPRFQGARARMSFVGSLQHSVGKSGMTEEQRA